MQIEGAWIGEDLGSGRAREQVVLLNPMMGAIEWAMGSSQQTSPLNASTVRDQRARPTVIMKKAPGIPKDNTKAGWTSVR